MKTATDLSALRARRPASTDRLFGDLRELVLVVSSSRGGSSVFTELLRHSPGLLHLQAEVNPYLALSGLTWPGNGEQSDALDADSRGDRDLLQAELSRAVGRWHPRPKDMDTFAAALTWRLAVQWPDLCFEPSQVKRWLAEAMRRPGDRTDLHLKILQAARRDRVPINPWFYDLDPERVREVFPDIPVPQGPPGEAIIEEPPFVTIRPWQTASAGDLQRCPLIIKTPSNAYRLPFWRALFPKARLRVLHLTRNPAASINGLVDGWRYHGFHAHKLSKPLTIPGYADRRPQDARWWKYDLPPGWQQFHDRPLEQVAALQWTSAHRAALGWLGQNPVDCLRVKFEDVVGATAARRAVFQRVCAWLGVPFNGVLEHAVMQGLPPVMATQRPRQRRWFARAELLEPVLANEVVQRTARELGYGDRDTWT